MGKKQPKLQPKTPRIPQISAKTAPKRPKTPPTTAKAAPFALKRTKAQSDRVNTNSRARYSALSPAERAERRWRQVARPPTPRKGTVRSRDARHVALANAYCDWSDIEELVRIYTVCAVLNELGWGVFVVDHMVPLTSNLVCGLHVHCNLRITPARENSRKGNSFWPQMWDQNWETLDLLLA